MFTFFPLFWYLTCPPRALKEKCLYFWDGANRACKYVVRSSLNTAGLKTFNLTKLALLVPEGERWQCSAVEPVVDTPAPPPASSARYPPSLSQISMQLLFSWLTQLCLISCTLSSLQNLKPMSLKCFLLNSGNFVWLQTVCITVKDIRGDFQLPTRENKSHTVSVLPKVIYFQSARCFQLNEVFPYQCTSLKLQWFAWIKPGKKSPGDYYTRSVSQANTWQMNGPVPIRAVLSPHLHLDKLRYLKVIAQLSYRAWCHSNEFHLSGL